MPFENKVAIITGGTGGLGKTVTRSFLEAGTRVAVTYIHESGLEELLSTLGNLKDRLLTLLLDVTREENAQEMVRRTVERFGQVDLLVNLAGGYFGGVPIAELEEKRWDSMMNLNLKSAFLCSKAVLPHMISRQSGRIVSIASKSAVQPPSGAGAYAVSKAGIVTLTQTIAAEVKDKNITANAIMPGVIDTGANRKDMPRADFSRWVRPEEVARLILFLCSDEAKDISGTAIPIYGKS